MVYNKACQANEGNFRQYLVMEENNMNKNWLYRILAIALVAMLALPMFAMAEEVETFDLGGEEGVELIEKKLDTPVPAVDPAMPDPTQQVWEWHFDENAGTDYSCTVDIDLANPEREYIHSDGPVSEYWIEPYGFRWLLGKQGE